MPYMTNIDGNLIRTTEQAKVYIPTFEHYELIEDKKSSWASHDYIIGYDGVKEPNKYDSMSFSPNTIVDSRDLLDSLLTLALRFNSVQFDMKKRKKEILKWCKKYGMPFSGGCSNSQSSINNAGLFLSTGNFDVASKEYYIKTSSEYYTETGYVGFNIEHFINFLSSLFIAYLSISHIENIDVADNSILEQNSFYKTINISYEERIKRTLDYFRSVDVQYQLFHNGTDFEFIPTFNNQLSLAKYQFALLIISKEEKGIRTCKCCGSLFSCTNKKQHFCSNCSPQKYYKRKKAQEKKNTPNT